MVVLNNVSGQLPLIHFVEFDVSSQPLAAADWAAI